MKFEKPYWVGETVPTYDFNKEIFEPGIHPKFPDGVVGIRCDDDFWVVAALPYSYKEVPVEKIIAEIFPHITDPVFGPDVIGKIA